MQCAACGNNIVMGTSRIYVRADGKVAHVKDCDGTAEAPPAPRPSTPAPVAEDDTRIVAIMRTESNPFAYVVTVGDKEVHRCTSGTALGQWKRQHPELRLERDAALVAAETTQREDRDRRALDRMMRQPKQRKRK